MLADPPDANSSDMLLVEAIAAGSALAFALLMQRYLRTVLAVAQRLLQSSAEADEVAQETFLRFWQYAGQWDVYGKASVRTWLCKVVANLCLDRLRRKPSVALDDQLDLVDERMDSAATLEQQHRTALVRQVLAQLPERQRLAVVLCYFEEMSMAEAAHVMELTVGAVESLLVRARRKLRDLLERRGLTFEELV